MTLGRSKQIISSENSKACISSLFILMTLIFGVKANTPYASLFHCKQTGLEVNVQKAENMSLFHEQRAAQHQKAHTLNALKVW